MSTPRFTIEDAELVATHLGIDFASVPFTVEQLRKGMDVELEHGTHDPDTDVTNDDPIITAKIAWAHLKERSDYYEALEIMEASPPVQQTQELPTIMPINVKSNTHPPYISVRGHVYVLQKNPAPDYIRVGEALFEKVGKKGDKWRILPKGWTKKSVESFWESIGGSVTKCRRKLEDAPGIDDSASFCASLKDLMLGTTEWRGSGKKKSAESLPQLIKVNGFVYQLCA